MLSHPAPEFFPFLGVSGEKKHQKQTIIHQFSKRQNMWKDALLHSYDIVFIKQGFKILFVKVKLYTVDRGGFLFQDNMGYINLRKKSFQEITEDIFLVSSAQRGHVNLFSFVSFRFLFTIFALRYSWIFSQPPSSGRRYKYDTHSDSVKVIDAGEPRQRHRNTFS